MKFNLSKSNTGLVVLQVTRKVDLSSSNTIDQELGELYAQAKSPENLGNNSGAYWAASIVNMILTQGRIFFCVSRSLTGTAISEDENHNRGISNNNYRRLIGLIDEHKIAVVRVQGKNRNLTVYEVVDPDILKLLKEHYDIDVEKQRKETVDFAQKGEEYQEEDQLEDLSGDQSADQSQDLSEDASEDLVSKEGRKEGSKEGFEFGELTSKEEGQAAAFYSEIATALSKDLPNVSIVAAIDQYVPKAGGEISLEKINRMIRSHFDKWRKQSKQQKALKDRTLDDAQRAYGIAKIHYENKKFGIPVLQDIESECDKDFNEYFRSFLAKGGKVKADNGMVLTKDGIKNGD